MQAQELFDVSGEIALVTGGGTGLGFAMARALAVNGAKVALAGKHQAILDAAVKAITESGGDATAVILDVRQEELIGAASDQVETTFGPVSWLINNAGVAHRDKASTIAAETLRNAMAVNVDGAFLVAQEAALRMIRDKCSG